VLRPVRATPCLHCVSKGGYGIRISCSNKQLVSLTLCQPASAAENCRSRVLPLLMTTNTLRLVRKQSCQSSMVLSTPSPYHSIIGVVQ